MAGPPNRPQLPTVVRIEFLQFPLPFTADVPTYSARTGQRLL